MRFLWAVSLPFIVACATTPSLPVSPSPSAAPFRLPTDVQPVAYRLALQIVPSQLRFSGSVEIDLTLAQARSTIYLHGRGLHVTKALVRAGGAEQAATFQQLNDDGMAQLTLASPVGPGPVTARLEYDAPFGERNDGLYRVRVEPEAYAFTQFEATSARLAFPGLDEPCFKAPLSLELTIPAGQVAAANTAIESRASVGDGLERIRFAPTLPLPTYLYAWVVGPFDVVAAPSLPPNAVRSTPLPLRGLAVRGHGEELADSLHFAAPTLERLEAYFGSPFPYPKLDVVAVPDFGAGAMENAGLITYRDGLLLYREATAPVDTRRDQEVTQAHEMAHQWFGDLVTLAWWDDTWLNESFAEWLDYAISQQVRPEFHYPMEAAQESSIAMTLDGLISARAVRQPIDGPGDIQNAFDAITYSKGQAVIRMFERYLTPPTFQAGVRRYIAAHAQSTAVAADLLSALSEVSAKDVTTAFRTFIDQAGIPQVDVTIDCSTSPARLKLHQQRYLPAGSTGDPHRLWQIPFCARYPTAAHDAQACTLLTTQEGALDLPGSSCPAWVHPNPDAEGYYRWSLPPVTLAALAAAPLSELDRLALASNLVAAEAANTVSYAVALPALAPLIKDEEPAVGEAAGSLLSFAEDRLAEDGWREKVQAREVALYQPVLAHLGLASSGPGEDPRLAERRRDAVVMLTESAADPATRAALAKLGRAYLPDPQGEIHPEALDPSLASRALMESVRAEPARADGLIARLATEQDPTVRETVLAALDRQQDDPVAARVRDLTLDPRLRTDEVLGALALQLGDRHTREAAWSWLTAHYAEVAKRLDDETRAAMPELATGFCTEAEALRAEAFFTPHLEEAPGSDRTLRQALESIRLCAAHVAAQRDSARSYFNPTPGAAH